MRGAAEHLFLSVFDVRRELIGGCGFWGVGGLSRRAPCCVAAPFSPAPAACTCMYVCMYPGPKLAAMLSDHEAQMNAAAASNAVAAAAGGGGSAAAATAIPPEVGS